MFQRSETTKIAVWSLDSGVRTSHRDIKFVWVRLWINSTKTKIFTLWQSYFEYFSCQINHYKYRYIQFLKKFPMNFHLRRVLQNGPKSFLAKTLQYGKFTRLEPKNGPFQKENNEWATLGLASRELSLSQTFSIILEILL